MILKFLFTLSLVFTVTLSYSQLRTLTPCDGNAKTVPVNYNLTKYKIENDSNILEFVFYKVDNSIIATTRGKGCQGKIFKVVNKKTHLDLISTEDTDSGIIYFENRNSIITMCVTLKGQHTVFYPIR